MQTKRFQRNREDFTCEKCGAEVVGSGYTNHCPACLWSKHVDVNPGDRKERCGGLMEPVGAESLRDSYVLLHRCTACGFERKNKVLKSDDFDTLLALARKTAEEA